MARVLNLGNVLELINDGFNDRPATQQDAIAHGDQLVLHVAAQLGNQLNIKQLPQGLRQGLRKIAFIAEELAIQLLG